MLPATCALPLANLVDLDNAYPLGTPGGSVRTDWADLPPGSFVNSFVVHSEQPAGAATPGLEGTITFDSAILGVLTMDGTLDATDNLLGNGETG